MGFLCYLSSNFNSNNFLGVVMLFTKEEVKKTCKALAPQYMWDWETVYAMCLVESAREQGKFDPSVARLEQGFYRRYVEDEELATTTEVLLSASYGIPQMMGQSLREAGYFIKYFSTQSDQMQSILGTPMSEIAVPKAINAFCVSLEWQIIYMCVWLNRKLQIGGSKDKAISLYNGDTTGAYLAKVKKMRDRVKREN